MNVEVMPVLIDQYRETFEGEVQSGMCWITDGKKEAAIFGTIDSLTPQQAFASPAPGAKSAAAHVEHLRFTLDITYERMQGKDPKPDWASSFNLPLMTPEEWETQKRELRRAYEAVLGVIQQSRSKQPQEMQPIHLVGLAAIVAHNAYHLGALRQIAQIVCIK